jgi:FKBP-type peptidyl-prolyl cis-trans isomerase
MIRTFIPGALALGLAAVSSAQTPAADAPKTEAVTPPIEVPAAPKADPATVKSDSSYALGYRTGSTFSQQFGRFGVTAEDLETENFLKGFMTALKGEKPDLGEDKLQAAMQALGDVLQAREKELAAVNLEAGKKFLEENAKREGVTTTASGMQYEVIEKGGEEKYKAPEEGTEDDKRFLVQYKGTLIDGKEFDASPEGESVPMTLNVVPGFKEALTTMPVGAKWRIYLPADLAYGENRGSADIGPNSTLIFDLKLEKIEDAPPQQGGMPFPMPQGVPGGE